MAQNGWTLRASSLLCGLATPVCLKSWAQEESESLSLTCQANKSLVARIVVLCCMTVHLHYVVVCCAPVRRVHVTVLCALHLCVCVCMCVCVCVNGIAQP